MAIKKVIESQIGNGVRLGTPIINENFAELEARLVALEPVVAVATVESANAKGQATATVAQDKTPGNSEFGHSHNNHGHNK